MVQNFPGPSSIVELERPTSSQLVERAHLVLPTWHRCPGSASKRVCPLRNAAWRAFAVAVGTATTEPVAITGRFAALVRPGAPALMPPSALEYAYVVTRSPSDCLADTLASVNICPSSRAVGPGSSTRGESGLRPSAKRKGALFNT